MPNQGDVRGQSVDLNFDNQINDLYRVDEMNRRSDAIKKVKVALFANDMDYQNAVNAYDSPKIQAQAKEQVRNIGKYVNENPDWETNIDKRMQVNMMKKELKDNPLLHTGLASDMAFKQLNSDLAEVSKNPQQHDTESYQDLMRQRENYLKFGNQKGEEAALHEGHQPFTYVKPRDFINLPETLLKAGNSINPSVVIKGNNMGEYTRTADPKYVQAVKDGIWKENSRQIQVEAGKLGLHTPQQVDKWLTDQIMAGVKTTYDIGDPDGWFNAGMRQREHELAKAKLKGKNESFQGITPWDDLFDKRKPSGYVPPESVSKVWGENPKILVSNSNGTNNIDLTGQKWTPDGRYITDGTGTRRLTGKVKIPLQVAYQTGIWKADDFKDDPKDGEIDKTFHGKAVRREDDKGNLFIEMNYAMPIDKNNGSDRSLYNAHILPDKLVNNLQESDVSTGGQTQTWNGYEIGSEIRNKKDGKIYVVTENGPQPK